MAEQTQNNNQKVALLISNLRDGGAQRVVATLSFSLAKHYDLYLVLHDGKEILYPYQGKLINLTLPAAPSAAGRLINFRKRISKLKELKKQHHFTAVVSFMESSNFVNLLAGTNGKTILSVRNYQSKNLNRAGKVLKTVFKIFIRMLYGKSSKIVAVSEGVKSDLIDNFGLKKERLTVIYNPYLIKEIKKQSSVQLNHEEKSFFNNPVLITVGSLSSKKGHGNLIRTFQEIVTKMPELKLAVIGRGELEAALKNLTADLGLCEKIRFLGYQANPFKYVAKSSAFILSSLYEGFPNVLVEAMACGVPVIAADCRSGPREILAPDTSFTSETKTIEYAAYGILVPVFKTALLKAEPPLLPEEIMLARSIVELHKNSKLYNNYRSKSLQRAKDFDLEKIASKWISVIGD